MTALSLPDAAACNTIVAMVVTDRRDFAFTGPGARAMVAA